MYSTRRWGWSLQSLLLGIRFLLLLALKDLGHRDMHMRHDGLGPAIGELANQRTPGNGNGTEPDRHAPFLAVQTSNLEGFPADEDDENLSADHDGVDDPEEVVARDALEDVEPVVETAVVQFIEDLEPDEGVENKGAVAFGFSGVRHIVAEEGTATKVEAESDGELGNSLANNHLPHPGGDQRRGFAIRLAVENGV